MTALLLLAMPGNEGLAGKLAANLGCEVGHIETRQFPDGEIYLRLLMPPQRPSGRDRLHPGSSQR